MTNETQNHKSALSLSALDKMFQGMVLCREKCLDAPLLVLLYSTIDTLGWILAGSRTDSVKLRFVEFCDTYLLLGSGLECTALELYAARCSVLHSLGWESDLSKSGKARAIFYSFGTDEPDTTQRAFDHYFPGRFIGVKADILLLALAKGFEKIKGLAKEDSEIKQKFETAYGKQYAMLESSTAESLFGSYLNSVGSAK